MSRFMHSGLRSMRFRQTVSRPDSYPTGCRFMWGDLGQKDDRGEGRERLPVLVHLLRFKQKARSATSGATQADNAALGLRGGEQGGSRFIGWHAHRHVDTVAARGDCGCQLRMEDLIVRGGLGAARANRRLDINVAIGADANNRRAKLGGIAQSEHCCQRENRCGH